MKKYLNTVQIYTVWYQSIYTIDFWVKLKRIENHQYIYFIINEEKAMEKIYQLIYYFELYNFRIQVIPGKMPNIVWHLRILKTVLLEIQKPQHCSYKMISKDNSNTSIAFNEIWSHSSMNEQANKVPIT